MRILVYPHDLNIGGSQINAIDLAAGAKAAGHEVIVYGVPGPLADYVHERGLRFIPAHGMRYRPAVTRIAQLASVASREGINLIHTYEWPPCLDAYLGASLFLRVPVLCTVLSMSTSPYVPKAVPLIMGTELLGEEARAHHQADVWVLEPPIDVVRDHPGIDGAAFRKGRGIAPGDFTIVNVSRLAIDLKLDSLVRAIDAVSALASSHAVKLLLVGDGPARAALENRADAVNGQHGRKVIQIVGELLDPREAYAAADLVMGMGSSALRALAIGRPVIVQGEDGFSEIFEPATLGLFLRQGFYGRAENPSGTDRLVAQISALMADSERRHALGEFGRETVCGRFSLKRATDLQLDIYRKVVGSLGKYQLTDAARRAVRAIDLEIANHNPWRKKDARARNAAILASAGAGVWPPAN